MKCIPRKKWFEVYTCHIDATMSENILSWGTLIDLKFHIITVHQLCYILICLSTLHTQHTTFFNYSIIEILVIVYVPIKILMYLLKNKNVPVKIQNKGNSED